VFISNNIKKLEKHEHVNNPSFFSFGVIVLDDEPIYLVINVLFGNYNNYGQILAT